MKITLNEAKTIKLKDYDAGDVVIVNKEVGERLIEEGVANRIIEAPENRSTTDSVMRFTGRCCRYRKTDGSDGKTYVKQGPDEYVEVKGE